MDKFAFAAEMWEKEGPTKTVIVSEAEKYVRNIRGICSDRKCFEN